MTTTALFADVEGPLRTWLRTQLPAISGRVFLAMPERCTYPALELSLVDGGIDPGEAPVANALVSFSAWDTNRAGAAGLAWSLVSVLHSARMEALDGTVMLLGARVVTGPVFRPDPDKFARYVTDAAVSVRVP